MIIASEDDAPWDPDATYVIGHQRPDTDAIAAAIAYAWYLAFTQKQPNTVAARAGQVNAQTRFALAHFGARPPRLLPAVWPTFGHAAEPHRPLAADAPLSAAAVRLVQGERAVPIAGEEGASTGAITLLALARAATAGQVDALSQPCRLFAEMPPTFRISDRISDHRGTLLRSDTDDFLVTDNAGQYVGVATRRRILEPPRARLVLVDHNELAQAVAGAEQAEIVEVLDHHRIGTTATALPIPFVVEPVGSTCTLIAERCRIQDVSPPASLCGLMLSGILSDTLVLRSPTTTERDQAAADWLASRAQVDVPQFGEVLLRASPGLAARTASEIIDADRKGYDMSGERVSIGQVEVAGFQELPGRQEELIATLTERQEREGLALLCLMVTDVVAGRSRLLAVGESAILRALPFIRLGKNDWNLGEVVSRKKQLVPALSAVLDESR